MTTEAAGPLAPALIVGLGASAGGLGALESFFGQTPPDSGMAYVVIQHLSPDFKSLMDDLLSRRTTMPIHRVEDGMVIEANNVYLLPPRFLMTLREGRLRLRELASGQRAELPIDAFLRSLAEDAGQRAVAIVLSGTGSDGSRGVQAVQEAGGLVLVQSPESAQFDGMPRAAIATGRSDLVVPPERMPQFLEHYSRNPAQARSDLALFLDVDYAEGEYAEVFALLRRSYRLDFSKYKTGTVGRRISRRMEFRHLSSIADYATVLASDSQECEQLYHDLLIGVTEFFRDRDTFTCLEKEVLPKLFSSLGRGEELRVWCAACATGEEAYSLAILLTEQAERDGFTGKITIFATDVHRASLEVASQGCYSGTALGGVNPQRRQRFFRPEGPDSFRVNNDLRKMVVFAPHNLLTDPPFTKMDLVCCRNLLIYFLPSVQERTLMLLHFALRPDGVLLLGSSEGLGALSGEFETMSPQSRIFRKIRDLKLPSDMLHATRGDGSTVPEARSGQMRTLSIDRQLLHDYDSILRRNLPPGVLVDGQRRVLHYFGEISQYLRMEGRQSADILQLSQGPLHLALSTLLQRAERTQESVSARDVVALRGGEPQCVDIRVEPIATDHGLTPHYHVTFTAVRPAEPADAVAKAVRELDLTDQRGESILELEAELRGTREALQSTIEELQATNEELQAANEEMLASNEELQSTNEELHSVNEELYSVNAEFERKNTELVQLNRDHENLLNSIDVGVIFLDQENRIRKYSPGIEAFFKLLPRDIGRPIDHIAYHLPDTAELRASIAEVSELGLASEREIVTPDGRGLLRRVLPFNSESGAVAGTVLTFVDITRLKQVEASLRGVVESLQLKVEASLEDVHEAMEQRQALHQLARESLQKYHALFDRIPLAIVVFDSTYRVCEANARADRLFGCAAGGLVVAGALPDDRHFVGIDGAAIDLPGLVRAAGSAPSASPYIELQLLAGGGERRWLTATTARLELPAGGMAVVFDDLTEQRQAEADYGTLFAQMLDSFADHEVLCDEHGEPCNLRLVSANPAFERINGISLAEATGRTLSQGWPSLEPYWADACLQVARTGQAVEFETWSEVLDKYLLVRAYRPAPRHVACICSDITRRKRAELEEQRLQVQLSQAQKMESIGRLAGGVAHDFNNLLTVINGYSQLLLESSEPGGPDHTALAAIQHAGEAAAGLTRELLAFSRRQVLDMKGLNLHEVIENIAPMLVRMLGEDVEVRFMLHAPRPFVLSDQHQLERVLLNLAVNARDAMPHGGTLSVSTTEVATLPRQSELLPAGASEGPYVLLTCADNGVGMSDDTRQHIFEPFFTTKEMGRGTGLGLAMVQGVVVQCGGAINVESMPGKGTIFRLYFPLAAEPAPQAVLETQTAPRRGDATILLAEDEDGVREFAVAVLSGLGYRVLAAGDVETALALGSDENVPVHLLLTDVVMPRLSGRDLAERMKLKHPGLRILFMSGYANHMMARLGPLGPGEDFIQKPFRIHELAAKIRAAIPPQPEQAAGHSAAG